MEIKPIRIPRPQIRDLPPPITQSTPPPVVTGIEPPVVDIPDVVIEYPTLDVPTQQTFEGQLGQPQEQPEEPPTDTRDLPPPTPTGPVVELPVVGEVPLPPVAPLVTAGATAVVVATVTMTSTILLNQVKTALEPALKRLTRPSSGKKKKIKIKQKKPILHYVLNDNTVEIFQYSADGTKFVAKTDKVEQYIRDQVEEDALYEYDNKLILDESLKDMFTKEGQKRFKKHFCPSKTIVKKLSARFSF